MKYLNINPEREQAVTELLTLRHHDHRGLALAIFKAMATLRLGGTAHRAIVTAEQFLRKLS